MIAQLRPRSHQEYLELPVFGPVINAFVEWSLARGFTVGTVKNQLKETRQVVAWMTQRGVYCGRLSDAVFEDAWEHFRHDRPAVAGTVRQWEQFCRQSEMMTPVAQETVARHSGEVDRFICYLRQVRGLAPSTVQAHRRYIERFLDFAHLGTQLPGVDKLRLNHVEEFLADCSKTVGRHSLQHVVGYLRSFLRFLYADGRLTAPLHEMLDSPIVYRHEKIPHCLPWTVVEALLDSIDRTDDQGVRNYAMLLLIATYGLRSCEVVALKLDDICWRESRLNISQSKNANELALPLTDGVANALIDYLRNVRPALGFREVFLRVRAPFGVLKPTAVADAFDREVRRSGLAIAYHGAHCLRHSYAHHLLQQGSSLKTIGDILGHRSAESTYVYLRLSSDELRAVALEAPAVEDVPVLASPGMLKALPSTRTNIAAPLTGPLHSSLAEEIEAYVQLHRSLGKAYGREERILRSLDAFLADCCRPSATLDSDLFWQWCAGLSHCAPVERRARMLVVRKFCRHRRRSQASAFVPNIDSFPPPRSQFRPFILSTSDVGRLLGAARLLPPGPASPLRAEVVELAILLLFTAGLRRGELLRLTLGHIDSGQAVLFIGSTKFHKERLLPLSGSVGECLCRFVRLRHERGAPLDAASPLIWNGRGGPHERAYTGTGLHQNWRRLCLSAGVVKPDGSPPRLHDLRHSFAVNALLRWYEQGADLLAKLPQLSVYMGHVSIASTQRYLSFVAPLRSAASALFEDAYATLGVRRTTDCAGIDKGGLEQ